VRIFELGRRSSTVAAVLTLLPVLATYVLVSAPAASAQPQATLCVGSGTGCYPTIAAAVAAAGGSTYAGDNVMVNIAASSYDSVDISGSTFASLTLDGAGSAQTEIDDDAGGSDVTVDSSSPVELENLAIDGGSGGGAGVRTTSSGTLTLDDDVLAGDSAGSCNDGGAVYDNGSGSLEMAGDTVSGDFASGGAGVLIWLNAGPATLTEDTISNNGAPSGNQCSTQGAGILDLSNSPLTLMDDTLSGDSAAGGGGAVNFSGNGSLIMTNDTVSGDSDTTGYGGGVLNGGNGVVDATDDTFYDDAGGGLYSGVSATVSSSIFADAGCEGTVVDGGYNVESDTSCFGGSSSGGANHLSTGTMTNVPVTGTGGINLASSLSANGSAGPATYAIGGSSAAFEIVPPGNAGCTADATDERGDPRPGAPSQSNCDAGAFEDQVAPSCSPSTGASTCAIAAVGNLAGGTLTVEAPSSLSWAATLTGTDQYVDVTGAPVTVAPNDATGSGAGWNLTAAASQFSGLGNSVLPANALSFNGSTAGADSTAALVTSCVGGNACTVPSDTDSYPVPVAASPASVLTAAAGSGMGAVDVDTDWWLLVPADATAGTYSNTVTLTIGSGP
jgi:hypothetical protein